LNSWNMTGVSTEQPRLPRR